MVKIICDKCKKEYKEYPQQSVIFPRVLISVSNKLNDCRAVDLCEDCKKAVYDFIFGGKENT